GIPTATTPLDRDAGRNRVWQKTDKAQSNLAQTVRAESKPAHGAESSREICSLSPSMLNLSEQIQPAPGNGKTARGIDSADPTIWRQIEPLPSRSGRLLDYE